MNPNHTILTGVAAFGLLTMTAMISQADTWDPFSRSQPATTQAPAVPPPTAPAAAAPVPAPTTAPAQPATPAPAAVPQPAATPATTGANAMQPAEETPRNFHPFTIGAEAGTTGFGGGADWRFSNHFGVGGSVDYFSYTYNGTIQDNPFDVKLRLQSEPITLNVYPWTKHSFHLRAGMLFNQNELKGSTTGNISLNGTTYPGPASLDIKQQPVDPYVSIAGNLYIGRGHHVSLGGELGVFYTGDPKVSLVVPSAGANNPDLIAEQNKIKGYAKDAEFWPVFKLSLNFSF